jgi:hypothetical protein
MFFHLLGDGVRQLSTAYKAPIKAHVVSPK